MPISVVWKPDAAAPVVSLMTPTLIGAPDALLAALDGAPPDADDELVPPPLEEELHAVRASAAATTGAAQIKLLRRIYIPDLSSCRSLPVRTSKALRRARPLPAQDYAPGCGIIKAKSESVSKM